jgi:hypothetical protein
MHNNGTNRLILPNKGPILASSKQVQISWEFEVSRYGICVTLIQDGVRTAVPMTSQQATELGVKAISAGALQQHVANMAAEAVKPPDPNAHELT